MEFWGLKGGCLRLEVIAEVDDEASEASFRRRGINRRKEKSPKLAIDRFPVKFGNSERKLRSLFPYLPIRYAGTPLSHMS